MRGTLFIAEIRGFCSGVERAVRLVECALATPAMGEDLCAAWVERAFARLRVKRGRKE